MRNLWKTLGAGVLSVAFALPAMAAGGGRGACRRDGSCGQCPQYNPDCPRNNDGNSQMQRKQQRKRDGSGQGQGQGQRKQERKRDGSCQQQ